MAMDRLTRPLVVVRSQQKYQISGFRLYYATNAQGIFFINNFICFLLGKEWNNYWFSFLGRRNLASWCPLNGHQNTTKCRDQWLLNIVLSLSWNIWRYDPFLCIIFKAVLDFNLVWLHPLSSTWSTFLDAIASPSTYPGRWVSGSFRCFGDIYIAST